MPNLKSKTAKTAVKTNLFKPCLNEYFSQDIALEVSYRNMTVALV